MYMDMKIAILPCLTSRSFGAYASDCNLVASSAQNLICKGFCGAVAVEARRATPSAPTCGSSYFKNGLNSMALRRVTQRISSRIDSDISLKISASL